MGGNLTGVEHAYAAASAARDEEEKFRKAGCAPIRAKAPAPDVIRHPHRPWLACVAPPSEDATGARTALRASSAAPPANRSNVPPIA